MDKFTPGRVVWVVFSSYDTFISQFLPKEWTAKFPNFYRLVEMTSGYVPYWGWLLILAGIFCIAVIEFAIRRRPPPTIMMYGGDTLVATGVLGPKPVVQKKRAKTTSKKEAEKGIEKPKLRTLLGLGGVAFVLGVVWLVSWSDNKKQEELKTASNKLEASVAGMLYIDKFFVRDDGLGNIAFFAKVKNASPDKVIAFQPTNLISATVEGVRFTNTNIPAASDLAPGAEIQLQLVTMPKKLLSIAPNDKSVLLKYLIQYGGRQFLMKKHAIYQDALCFFKLNTANTDLTTIPCRMGKMHDNLFERHNQGAPLE